MKKISKKDNEKMLETIKWAFELAWKFDKKMLIMCNLLISVAAVLPAIALVYKKEIIYVLEQFVQTGTGSFQELLSTIIIFGIITAFIGVSNRLNEEFVYSVMFDSYYFGMEEVLMDSVQTYTMEELLQKDTNDDYNSCVMREGALTDFISGCCTLLGKFIGLISLLAVAFSMSKIVFFVSLIYITGMATSNLLFVEKLRMSWKKIREQERLTDYYEKMTASTECAKEIRIFKSGEYIIQKWRDTYAAIYDYEIKNNLDVELRTFFCGMGFYLFLAVLMIYSLFLVARGQVTSDVLLIIFSLGMNIFNVVSSVARTLTLTDYGLYALEKQYQFFGRKEIRCLKPSLDKSQSDEDPEVIFEARNLSFAYKADKLVLDNVSFHVKKGEVIALVGLNGSGKSTLVKLLLQLYKPISGEIFFCGINYNDLEEGFLKNKIGTFFQDFYLFHMSIRENVGFGDVENVNDIFKINNAIDKAGAKNIVEKVSKGLDSFIHKSIEKTGLDFSGGESQKLAVARAYMSNKDILIFDEPASMLDPISELEQFMNIRDSLEGKTAILISHRIGFARLADKIILMDKGKIVESGTHDELLQLRGVYAKFFHEQAQWYQEKLDD